MSSLITYQQLLDKSKTVAVIGQGYVGLPLALELAKHFRVIGYDIDEEMVSILQKGKDPRGEVDPFDLKKLDITFTSEEENLTNIGVYIVAVPTPITKLKSPDLRPLKSASQTVGRHLESGAIVIYESTVYPGCTEEDCLPILESLSGLEYKREFWLGYSPERINPGDKVRTLTNTVKIVAGDCQESLDVIADLYNSIITAGLHLAPSIKVAEAAKIVENTQRDLNIALMNELSIIFDLMDINTHDVLDAAGTKWNFHKYFPGLVGGHCIGVDPYYLTYKAESLGYKPEIILSGRKVNDNLSKHVVKRVLHHLESKSQQYDNARVLVLGITFKENVSDIRNSKVVDVVQELEYYGLTVDVFDPNVDTASLLKNYGLKTVDTLQPNYHAIIYAVNHQEFQSYDRAWMLGKIHEDGILLDIKNVFANHFPDRAYWSL